MATPRTVDNVMRVSIEPTEGSSHTSVSPNWADQTTWFWKSQQNLGVVMVDSGSHIVYNPPAGMEGPWVDNYHAKYSNEEFALTEEGHVPRLKVYVNGVEKTEQDPHLGTGGDYTVDYQTGSITFLSPLAETDVVTADIYKVYGSEFIIKPAAGKKLKIVRVEAQFSKNLSIRDSIVYQLSINGSPYGDPTVYKSMRDFVNESDGALPLVVKTSNPLPSWRDMADDIQVFQWNYMSVIELKSSISAEVCVKLKHDVPFDGSYATATFYCLSYTEDT